MNDSKMAAEGLERMAQSRQRLASRADWPPSTHWLFGLIMAALVASQALPLVLRLPAVALILFGISYYAQWWTNRLGFFVNGFRRGRARWVAILLTGLVVLLLVGSVALSEGYGLGWAPLAGGALAFLAGTAGSYAWQRAYRADLEREVGG